MRAMITVIISTERCRVRGGTREDRGGTEKGAETGRARYKPRIMSLREQQRA